MISEPIFDFSFPHKKGTVFDFWDHALTWPKIMWKLERKSKTIKIWLNKYNVATEHFLRYIYPPKTVSLIVSNNQPKLIAETQTC